VPGAKARASLCFRTLRPQVRPTCFFARKNVIIKRLTEKWAIAHFFYLVQAMSGEDWKAVGNLIERVVAREKFELVHWEVVGPPGRLLLRVYIDKPGGITLDDCEAVSKQLSLVLDVEDPIAGSYTLEVSSPGVERGLYKPADYERFAGNRIKLKTSQMIKGQRNFRGKLIGIEHNVIRLVDDIAGQVEIPYERVVKANIEYKF
jgi:ribosome maturation factor RimP